MNLSRAILVLLTFFSVRMVSAQDKCELVLVQATEEFSAGHFYSIPSLLKDCLDQNQNRTWRQRAYLLLAQTYLLLDDPIGAENSYLEVLRANPEYLTDDKRDPIDLVYLSSKFTATPIFSLFAKIGPNISVVRPILRREAFVDDLDKKYSVRPGFQMAVGVDWNYNEKLSASVEGTFAFTSYYLERTGVFGRDKLEMKDNQSWIRLPLSIKYSDDKGKYRPYGYAGLSVDVLLRDRATFTYTDANLQLTEGELTEAQLPAESPVINLKSKRNILNYSWFVGGGIKYKLGLQYAFVDLRYSFGMTNLVNTDNSMYNYGIGDRTSENFQNTGDPTMMWGHIDDYFRLDNLFLSVGYVHPLYKPRKLKKARSRSVLRSIKKQKS